MLPVSLSYKGSPLVQIGAALSLQFLQLLPPRVQRPRLGGFPCQMLSTGKPITVFSSLANFVLLELPCLYLEPCSLRPDPPLRPHPGLPRYPRQSSLRDPYHWTKPVLTGLDMLL